MSIQVGRGIAGNVLSEICQDRDGDLILNFWRLDSPSDIAPTERLDITAEQLEALELAIENKKRRGKQ